MTVSQTHYDFLLFAVNHIVVEGYFYDIFRIDNDFFYGFVGNLKELCVKCQRKTAVFAGFVVCDL